MKCNNCGTENADGQQYCQGCGAALYGQSNMYTQQNQNTYGQQNAGTYAQQNAGTYGQQNLYSQHDSYNRIYPSDCFLLGGTKNVNLKNFARSYFCVTIIVLVVVLIIAAMGGLAIFESSMNM